MKHNVFNDEDIDVMTEVITNHKLSITKKLRVTLTVKKVFINKDEIKP